MSAQSANPSAVAASLRVRTMAAIAFVEWSIAELHKVVQERPDLADSVQFKNADQDLLSLKLLLKKQL
jgi:hypothetical protein